MIDEPDGKYFWCKFKKKWIQLREIERIWLIVSITSSRKVLLTLFDILKTSRKMIDRISFCQDESTNVNDSYNIKAWYTLLSISVEKRDSFAISLCLRRSWARGGPEREKTPLFRQAARITLPQSEKEATEPIL